MPEPSTAVYHDHEQDHRADIFTRSVAAAGESILKYEDRATGAWLISSLAWLMVATLLGFTIANELFAPNLFTGIPWLIFPRLRAMHVNTVIFFWLTTMYWGAIWYILPRLLGRPRLWGENVAWWTAIAWDVVSIAGEVTLANGYTQGREYWELIWPIDVAFLILWFINIAIVIGNVLKRRVKPLYVSIWWFLASPLWLASSWMIANAIWQPGNMLGNGIPGAALSGAWPNPLHDVMMNWWGSHNLFGLWLTPILIGITYYMVPRITGTPLYSHALSLLSFWGVVFFYSGVGHHHLLQAPIPSWLRVVATVNSIGILMAVIAFFSNIWMTMRGNW